MLDIKLIRKEPEMVKESLRKRKSDPSLIDRLLDIDEQRRDNIGKADELKNTRNVESKKIGKMKKEGKDIQPQAKKVREIGDEIKRLNDEIRSLDVEIYEIMSVIPNIPSEKVPPGKDDSENVEVRRWGEIPEFSFTPLPHWDIGEKLDILDIPRAVKLSKTRFTLLKGMGAALERALTSFMLDVQTRERGYTEILPPFLVNPESMLGSGQLPKFEEDLFKCEKYNLYLIPTAEVPLTNYHANEIIDEEDLPLYYSGYSACFRSEAGSAGKDTRGLTRNHQFDKVELVKFTHPDNSYDELEKMLNDAEEILKRLKIPYRVMIICLGDLGFTPVFKYDLEFWAPGQNRWVEVSSCSNCTDFQARRANIRFKSRKGGKPDYVHTLNGSGLAVGRTLAAVLENYQNEDGSVTVPEVLRPYMHGLEAIMMTEAG
ncbi:MAG: serine--tRNA ligase [Candidatus Eremiobacteraeota bacterium]|nr:serine--tRNA ligase [Candidatus Eremiobacteraeota bacterium]